MELIKKKLEDIGKIVGGSTPSTKNLNNYGGDISWITPKDMTTLKSRFISRGEKNITEEGFKSCSTFMLPVNSILFSSRAPIGYIAINTKETCTNQGFKSIIPNNNINYMYLYYLLKNNISKIESYGSGTTFKEVSGSVMKSIELNIVENVDLQIKIAKVLSFLDDKIELNNQINNNLYEIIDNLYKNSFNNIISEKRADEIADITIGKTPPRNKKECFTTNQDDIKWISISDLGKCGTYILNTNEMLTKEAVEKYNVKIIPKDTIILSFKLTVGRIAITTEKMATNEAIAHFNLYNDTLKYYLYSYLKNFDYGKLGSTSSIATAVNSKIIKAMKIDLPSNQELESYNQKVLPLFKVIENNEYENKNLTKLRDTLLPKLMNGEIDLENIEI